MQWHGYSKAELQAVTASAISMMIDLRATYARDEFPMLVSGCVDPRDDGYVVDELTRPDVSEAYHDERIGAMLGAGADMINCAHPTHFEGVLDLEAEWTCRIQGIRANASICSHEELNEASDLDRGDTADLAARYRALADAMPQLRVFGGCCGADHIDIAAIA